MKLIAWQETHRKECAGTGWMFSFRRDNRCYCECASCHAEVRIKNIGDLVLDDLPPAPSPREDP